MKQQAKTAPAVGEDSVPLSLISAEIGETIASNTAIPAGVPS